jgi:hypothetical protein
MACSARSYKHECEDAFSIHCCVSGLRLRGPTWQTAAKRRADAVCPSVAPVWAYSAAWGDKLAWHKTTERACKQGRLRNVSKRRLALWITEHHERRHATGDAGPLLLELNWSSNFAAGRPSYTSRDTGQSELASAQAACWLCTGLISAVMSA